MMKLCVIGNNSFIAKNLDAEVKLSREECDLLNYKQTLEALARTKPTAIINCAAKHGSFQEMTKNHVRFYEDNILMNINLLRAAHELDIDNVLLLGSISSFPFDSGENFDESDFYSGPVNEKNFGYNSSKRALVELVKSYQLDHSRNFKVVHLGNIYGPHANFHANSTLVANLIFQITEAKKLSQDLELYGDGTDIRALTFVKDLNQIFSSLIQSRDQREPVIISSQEEISIKELSEGIAEQLDFKGRITFVGPSNKSTRKVATSSLLPKLIPDFKFTSLNQGLKKTVEWWTCNN